MEPTRIAIYDHYAYAVVALIGTALAAWAIWRTLDALARGLPEPQQAGLRASVRDHSAATAAEWQALARRQTSAAAQQSADRLLDLVASPAMAQAAGASVYRLMLDTVAHLRDDRDQRIALSQFHVNPFKWMGMAFLGLLTMLSIAVVHVEHLRAAATALILFAVAAAPTAAIVLMQGNPFQSPSFVSSAPIAQLAPPSP